ncbi:MAG: NifB/NifX family molybdenum-iron cluster-binding protein [Candidatus Hydrogenedentes bacterium]|nr:NifB/NifX family molybdenum-iron cluster-binding protein [Candidatus Hydrogenedentota bacterium]
MRVAIPAFSGRISPVFDAARHLLLVDIVNDEQAAHSEVALEEMLPYRRASFVAGLGVDVLICGAVSWPLAALLESAGVRVIAHKCGAVDEVLRAFLMGRLDEGAFPMPGWQGGHRQRRRRGRGRGTGNRSPM